GRVEALERAWAVAGLDPRQAGSVGLVEAHGSGVREDDAAELEALAQVFGPACDDDIAVIGSVKSMIGHAMSAAGIAGLVKAALAVHRGVLLPTLNCETPNPAMEATRFRPLATACPWVSSEPRRAVVNAFGIGGANAHVILEQAPVGASPASAASTAPLTLPPARPPRRTPPTVSEPEQVLRFAAPTPEALIDLLDDDDAILRERGAGVPQYQGPGSRLGLVGPSERRLAVARRVARGARGGGWASWRGRNDVWLSSEPLLTFGQGRVAYVFPGLEAELAPHLDDVAEHFGLPWSPLPADGIGRHGSAVLRIGRVLEKALHRIGVVPSALAGHSIGEWNALYASGAVDADNVEDVVFGSVMDDIAALDVDYASLACPLEQAMEAIGNRPGIVVSHDNAPQQTIVCGPPAEIADLVREQRHRNVLAQVLPFRSGFHTPRLAPYLEEIARRVDAVPIRRGPGVELWSATLAGRYPDDPEQIRALTLRHLLEPVRFRPTILAMYSAGVRVFLQVGQGRLGGLIDDTLGFLPHLTIAANSSRRSGLDQLRRVAVALWVEGGAPDFDALKARSGFAAVGVSPHEDSLPQRDPVRMDLGTRLVTLDPAVLPRTDPVSAPVSALAPADGGDRGPARPTATGLEGWAQRDPLARELLDLLDDTARTAVTALEQVAGTRAVPSAGDRPDPASEYGGESVGEYDREPDPIETTTTSVPVSLESMPYLLDHCLAPQRRGWPEPADRRPVVPATTIVELMADLAAKAAPGKVVVGLTEVRFDRWLLAAPSTDVAVGVQPVGPDTVSVSFGEYARAVVRLADSYPDAGHSPWPHEGSQEYPPVISGPDLYTKRWLFHGPRFQGVATIIGHGDTHVRAVLTAGTAPGALLDAAGQLLAYFARVMLPDRYVLFPSAIDQIDFYGPAPAPGTPVTCLVWVPWTERDWLRAHLQLTVDGRVWAEVNGWVDRRFDVRPDMDEAFRFPERHAVGRRMPGGWTMVAEPWSDLATRDLFAGRYLGAAERQEFADLPPRDRRRWLLVRIAVKDAVRARLWDAGHEEVFPAETRVVPDGDGGFVVIGEHGLDLPPIRVRAAFHGDVAVASALPPGGDGAGTGIDIEEVRDRPQQAIDAALAAGEQELAADLARRTGLSALTWHTRFLAAKGAAGAATGVTGRPHGFTVTVTVTGDATRDRTGDGTGLLAVTTPSGPVVPVRVQEVSGPEHHPGRTYVVAWSEQAPAGARRDARIDAHPGGMS
ncbi:MAG: hypothetical protein QG622_967, partial [Actinomycetota bacterium]|nr:hypothetical protein [Actinomycetota bacterium]